MQLARELWTLGDSTAQPLGEALASLLKGDALKPRSIFKNSSGLMRPDFFDWPKTAKSLVQTRSPLGVLVSFGANDTQGLWLPSEKRAVQPGTPEWGDEYAKRVRAFVDIFAAKGTEVFMVGQPFDSARKYAPMMRAVNDAFRKASEGGPHSTFIDGEALLADDEGHFQRTIEARGKQVLLRNDDGIHLTFDGAHLLATRALSLVKKKLGAS